MRHQSFASVCAVALVAFSPILVPAFAAAQDDGWSPPRLANGEPDLQGVWDFRSLTPLQRPTDLADREVLTDEEAAAYTARQVEALDKDRAGPDGRIPLSGGYNEFWYEGLLDSRVRTHPKSRSAADQLLEVPADLV